MYGIAAMAISYLCGSIPSSVWWGKGFFGVDIREHGSHNLAPPIPSVCSVESRCARSIARCSEGFPARPPAAYMERCRALFRCMDPFTGTSRISGRRGTPLSCICRLSGWQGIATSLGGILAIHPGSASICIIVFFIIFIISRYVSLASLVAAIAFPVAVTLVFHEPSLVMKIFAWLLCVVVFYTHRQNIGRLVKGNESRMDLLGRSTSKL